MKEEISAAAVHITFFLGYLLALETESRASSGVPSTGFGATLRPASGRLARNRQDKLILGLTTIFTVSCYLLVKYPAWCSVQFG